MNQGDRELLIRVAKKAGYLPRENVTYSDWILIDEVVEDNFLWNPLDNDGDALRLAVKCLPFYVLKYTAEDYEHCNEDGYAATRRAIVLAVDEVYQ